MIGNDPGRYHIASIQLREAFVLPFFRANIIPIKIQIREELDEIAVKREKERN